MKKIILLGALLAIFPAVASGRISTSDLQTVTNADWGWRDAGRGALAGSAQLNLFESTQYISIVKYPAKKFLTDIINDQGYSKERSDTAATTSAMARKHKCIAAINGTYFIVKTRMTGCYTVDEKAVEANTHPHELFRVDGLLTVKGKNQVGIIDCADTLMYQRKCKGMRDATASGPILLRNGVSARGEWPETSFYMKRHPRTALGVTENGWVYLIAVDGRFKGQADGMTIEEMAALSAMLGLKDCINLDGGGSTTLWTEKFGVLNHPYDNHKFDHDGERVVPNIVGIR